jgi:AcrR family transcriptional regulator
MTDTKINIAQRAFALFLRYGIKSVTMDDIARELAMSKKTLYQFFENKNDLLTQIMKMEEEHDRVCTEHIAATTENAIDEVMGYARHGMEEMAKTMSAHSAIYDLQKYYREIWDNMEKRMNDRIYTATKTNIERGIREGLYRPEVDADVIAKLYVSKLMSLIDDSVFPFDQYHRQRLFKSYLDYHIHGIATPEGLALMEEKWKTLTTEQNFAKP